MGTIDLRDARNVLGVMEKRGQNNHKNFKIGIVQKDIRTFITRLSNHPDPRIPKGTIVLFISTGDDECTVEIPFSKEELLEQEKKGSYLIGKSTTVGVPESYIDEILL